MGDRSSDLPVVPHMLTLSQIHGESGRAKPDASTQQTVTKHSLHKDAYGSNRSDSPSIQPGEPNEHSTPLHDEVYGQIAGRTVVMRVTQPAAEPQIEAKIPDTPTATDPKNDATHKPKPGKDALQECDYRSRNIERKRPDWTRCIPDD